MKLGWEVFLVLIGAFVADVFLGSVGIAIVVAVLYYLIRKQR